MVIVVVAIHLVQGQEEAVGSGLALIVGISFGTLASCLWGEGESQFACPPQGVVFLGPQPCGLAESPGPDVQSWR